MQNEQVYHVETKASIQLSTFRHLMLIDRPQINLSSVQQLLNKL